MNKTKRILMMIVFALLLEALSMSAVYAEGEGQENNKIPEIIHEKIIIKAMADSETSSPNIEIKIGLSNEQERERQRQIEEEQKRRAQEEQERQKSVKKQLKTVTVSSGNIQIDQLVEQYANQNGIPQKAGLIRKIVQCESGGNPNAKNRYSTAGGLAQYLDRSWASTAEGQQGLSKYDPNAALSAMSRDIAQGNISKWNASRRCWSR